MFYKKRIEELERELKGLIKELEESKAIGEYYGSGVYAYSPLDNERTGKRAIRNSNTLQHLFEYLGVMYVTESTRLVKKEEGK